nr:hypothetical protein CFP56_50554 [Quercus suber]
MQARILNCLGIQMPILFPEFVASAFLHSQQLIFQRKSCSRHRTRKKIEISIRNARVQYGLLVPPSSSRRVIQVKQVESRLR